MTVFPIPSELVREKWHLLLRFLLPAIEGSNGRWEPDDVLTDIESGKLQAWAVLDGGMFYGCGITAIRQYPRLKALECLWLGGVEADQWLAELDRVVCEWAVKEGCTRLEMVARKGWERMGAPLGFRPRFVLFDKEVGDGSRQDDRVEQASPNTGHAGLAEATVQGR